MKTVSTFTATIWVGQRIAHEVPETNDLLVADDKVIATVQEYVDAVGLCVTITPTTFVYTKGRERGVAVGLINYPRFPAEPSVIREHALELAQQLLRVCRQGKVSVVFPDETVMFEREEVGRSWGEMKEVKR